jgi:SAM-dependent methyltransferase
MRINYDRQREIYSRRKQEALQNLEPLVSSPPPPLSAVQTVGQWRQERIMAPLRPLLQDNHNWLTIGDGNLGSEAQWLQQQGVKAHATDLAADLLELAFQQGLISSWSQENAEELSFADSSFDYVLIKEAFHHFPRPWLALYDAFRVCRLGVILLEPNGEHPRPLSILLRRLRRQPTTVHYRFEKVGNFVYAPSPIELEKFLLGLGGHQIAMRFYNDHWRSAEADSSPMSGGTPHQRGLRRSVMRTISRRNLLGRSAFVPFGKLGCVMFKQPVDPKVIKSMEHFGWQSKELPANPYAK